MCFLLCQSKSDCLLLGRFSTTFSITLETLHLISLLLLLLPKHRLDPHELSLTSPLTFLGNIVVHHELVLQSQTRTSRLLFIRGIQDSSNSINGMSLNPLQNSSVDQLRNIGNSIVSRIDKCASRAVPQFLVARKNWIVRTIGIIVKSIACITRVIMTHFFHGPLSPWRQQLINDILASIRFAVNITDIRSATGQLVEHHQVGRELHDGQDGGGHANAKDKRHHAQQVANSSHGYRCDCT